ncbi:MAG TPA: hypothetical protein VJL88_08820 [Nitrospira sp.]|nr:hypothetical protein [Nitrospira sp.]
MTIPLILNDSFASEEALRDMIARRKVCFDHDPLVVNEGSGQMVQIGFELNLYAAFQDPRHLPIGEDPELREMMAGLQRLCRVLHQSLALFKHCRRPDAPMYRVLYSPERRYRAEVCLQVPIFDREHYGRTADRPLEELVSAVECMLIRLGARRGKWDDDEGPDARALDRCEHQINAAIETDRANRAEAGVQS